MLGLVLAAVGIAGLVFGSLQLAAAASARDRAQAAAAERMEVLAEQEATEATIREVAEEADAVNDSEGALSDGIIDIFRNSSRVRGLFNQVTEIFNRSVNAYNAGNVSESISIVETESDAAIDLVADSVERQEALLRMVRRALRDIERELEA